MDRKGFQTSEFWLTVAVHLLTFFVNAGVLADTHIAVKVASYALSVLAQLGYTYGRTVLKKAALLKKK